MHVLARGTAGKTEQSATSRPVHAVDAQALVDDRAHGAGAGGVVVVGDDRIDGLVRTESGGGAVSAPSSSANGPLRASARAISTPSRRTA